MKRRLILGIGTVLAIATGVFAAGAAPSKHDVFARRVFAITELVLERHIDPPTRQQMILDGLRASLAAAKVKPSPEFSRRVSDLRTVGELGALLEVAWPKSSGESNAPREEAFLNGLLHAVPGNAYLLPASEARVQAQLQGNRYIGIGIALGLDEKTHFPRITMVVPGGPAANGGMKVNDLIEQIDKDIVPPGAKIGDVVNQLRGAEGTRLTLRVRQPDSKETRTLALVRLPVMFKSIHSTEDVSGSEEVNRVDAKLPIAYLKIGAISASSARELEAWEVKLRAAGIKALILDLRSAGGRGSFDAYHSAVLLADSLLDSNPVGKLRTRGGVREFHADRDCLFRGWPLAVLIDQNTSGPAEWVAAALQDAYRPPLEETFDLSNLVDWVTAAVKEPISPSGTGLQRVLRRSGQGRAILIGSSTRGANYVLSAIPVPNETETLVLATGLWERPNAARQLSDTVQRRDRSGRQNSEAPPGWCVNPDFEAGPRVADGKSTNHQRTDVGRLKYSSGASTEKKEPIVVAMPDAAGANANLPDAIVIATRELMRQLDAGAHAKEAAAQAAQ